MPELMREGMFETVAVVEVGMPTAGEGLWERYIVFIIIIQSYWFHNGYK